MKEPMRLTAVAMVMVTAAVGTAVLARGDDNKAPAEVTVHFAMPQRSRRRPACQARRTTPRRIS